MISQEIIGRQNIRVLVFGNLHFSVVHYNVKQAMEHHTIIIISDKKYKLK